MIDKLIRFSIDNKLVIGLLILGLIAWGGYSLKQLPIDAVPDITNNQVQIITTTPSLAAPEVERLITYPVEISMANIPGIVEIRSFSRFGLSSVTVVFEDDIDVYWARQQVNERLSEAKSRIPEGIGTPELAPVTTGLGEIYQYIVYAKEGYEDQYSAMELRTIQDWIIKRQLLGTPGVAEVSSLGGYLKQYEIAIDPERLKSADVSIPEIFTALEKNNQNSGGAYIDKRPTAYFIRTEGMLKDEKDIENIVIRNNSNGAPVLIADIAEVKLGSAVRYGASTGNANGEVVSAIVMMLKGANSAEVIENIKERVKQIEKTLPEGVGIEPFLDRTKLVDSAIGTVSKNLIEGALIVIFILILFLGNVRAGLVVASVIPLAMLFAFGMMNLFGVSGNLMSLGAIDFGLIVDGAVIIVESIVHRIQTNKDHLNKAKLSRVEMDDQVYHAASRIRSSAAFGEIIILIVYLPILALVGIEGKMFKPMAQTVSFAILGAFLLSITYVPMMSAWALSRKTKVRRNISDRMIDFFQKLYTPVIHFALRFKLLVLGVAVALFALSLFTFSRMGGEFIPSLDEGDFAVEVRLMPGSSLSETIAATSKAEKIILDNFPEVAQVVSKVGSGEIPTDPMPIEACDLMIILKDKDEWVSAETKNELAEKMSEKLSVIPGVNFGFQQPIQMRFNELMTGAKQDVVVKVYGEDLDKLTQYAKQIGKLVNTVEGAEDLYVEQVTGLPQIQVEFKREEIARYGLNIRDLNSMIETAFAGKSAGLVYEGERRFNLVVRMDEKFRQSIENVSELFVSTPKGHQIPLSQVAKVSYKEGPNQIQRDDTKRRIIVGFNVRNRDVESIVEELRDKVNRKVKFEPGYYTTYGGQFQNLVEARNRLAVAVPVALLLIFVLLFFTFKSLKQSFLIFTAIPFSAIGGVFALYLRDMPFSISAGVGFIALFGVAVLNGIVLIAEFNHLKEEGIMDIRERVIRGTKARLRPVLMTAMVASFGFLPMALSGSSGAEVQRPLATVVIGGLITATFLTLMVLPVLYIYFERGLKGAKHIVAVLVIGLALGWPSKISAQQVGSEVITLSQAIEFTLKNHPRAKISEQEVALSQQDKKSSLDFGKTRFSWQRGQINSLVANDNYFFVGQDFKFPTVYLNQAKVADAAVSGSELKQSVTENELVSEVKSSYCNLNAARQKQVLYKQLDSLYSNFAEIAETRYRSGEVSYLEKVTYDSEQMEIRNETQKMQSKVRIELEKLNTLIHSDRFYDVEISFKKYASEINMENDSVYINNPSIQYLKQLIELEQTKEKLEKAQMLPEFSVGYFNASMIGYHTVDGVEKYLGAETRFQGFQVGVAVPLWAKPHVSRVRKSQMSQELARQQLEKRKNELDGLFAVGIQKYLMEKNNLAYYEEKALKQAEVLFEHSKKAYEAGEIGYAEYIRLVRKSITIRMNSIDAMQSYNQSLIHLEYLAGKK